MKNLKKMIKNNIYLRVDFDNRYVKEGVSVKQETDFFIIGTLPVIIIYKDGKEEKAGINGHVKVKKDPNLRSIQGVCGANDEKYKLYAKEVGEIVSQLKKAFMRISNGEKFKDKEVDKILIINFDKNGKRKTDKN